MMNDYLVYCHLCEMRPYGDNDEDIREVIGENPAAHLRSDCVLLSIGRDDYVGKGGLWHCEKHSDACIKCNQELLCDAPRSQAEYRWVRRHSRAMA